MDHDVIGHRRMQDLLNDPRVVVVEVLDPESFSAAHIPGAVNVPLRPDDFLGRFEQAVPDPETRVVVYASQEDPDAAHAAARRLIAAGYRHVFEYAEGKEGWQHRDSRLEEGSTHIAYSRSHPGIQ